MINRANNSQKDDLSSMDESGFRSLDKIEHDDSSRLIVPSKSDLLSLQLNDNKKKKKQIIEDSKNIERELNQLKED